MKPILVDASLAAFLLTLVVLPASVTCAEEQTAPTLKELTTPPARNPVEKTVDDLRDLSRQSLYMLTSLDLFNAKLLTTTPTDPRPGECKSVVSWEGSRSTRSSLLVS